MNRPALHVQDVLGVIEPAFLTCPPRPKTASTKHRAFLSFSTLVCGLPYLKLLSMKLDPDVCYRAIESRDERFDGRFYTGVLTTGVYCRPICPSRTPHRENVRFFATAAAAEANGFRPCLRCRPETTPGSPAWQGTATTVRRALRLIEGGALDTDTVETFSGRLGVSSRHLRRLFAEHVGASPGQVARTRRLHLAKRLIDATTLPMTEVAFSAGYSSVRRFNAAVRQTYDRTPTELRRERDHPPSESQHLHLTLSCQPPFDGKALLGFLQARAIPGIEEVSDSAYRRIVCVGDSCGIIEIRPDAAVPCIRLKIPAKLARGLRDLIRRARALFDLKADPETITGHLSGDPLLKESVRAAPGMRVPGAWDPFEVAVRAVLGQQVSVQAANRLAKRLVETHGRLAFGDDPSRGDGSGSNIPEGSSKKGVKWFLFPAPTALVDAPLEEIGLFSQRAEAIRALSRAIASESLDLTPEKEETIAQLKALPGIGPWTAQYIAMRALGNPDAFPSSDLGLRKAAGRRQASHRSEDQAEDVPPAWLRKRAEKWRPWRAYAAMHLWNTK